MRARAVISVSKEILTKVINFILVTLIRPFLYYSLNIITLYLAAKSKSNEICKHRGD